jgi:hypothetical protein
LGRRHSDERSESFHSSYGSEGGRGAAEQMRAAARRQHNRSPKPRPRRMGMQQRYSADFELVGGGQDAMSPEEVVSPRQRQRPEVGSTPSLYTIFQNILQVQYTCTCTCIWMYNYLRDAICFTYVWGEGSRGGMREI